MRRAYLSVSRSVLLLFSIVLALSLSLSLSVSAQEATPVGEVPPATDEETDEVVTGPDGIGFEFLGAAATDVLPENPASLNLLRFTFAPNSGFVLSPDDPATGFLYVETGTLSFRVDSPMTIFRAATTPSAPGDIEQVPAGEVFTMSRGDATVFPPSVPGETRNLGDEPASILVLNIAPLETAPTGDDAPADATPADAAATPMP
jgi:hypothetical protein